MEGVSINPIFFLRHQLMALSHVIVARHLDMPKMDQSWHGGPLTRVECESNRGQLRCIRPAVILQVDAIPLAHFRQGLQGLWRWFFHVFSKFRSS